MNRKKILFWGLIGGAVLFFVVFLKSIPMRKGKSSDENVMPQTLGEVNTAATAIGSSQWGRDPFVLGEIRESFSSDHLLTGIIYDEASPAESFAIVEGELVRAGDSQGNWRVRRIEKDRVILEVDGKEEEVLLNPPQ